MNELPDLSSDISKAIEYWENFVNNMPYIKDTDFRLDKSMRMTEEFLKKWLDVQLVVGMERHIDEHRKTIQAS